jgi:CheY-like chemotaxis protein
LLSAENNSGGTRPVSALIAVVEDNPGDFYLISEALRTQARSLHVLHFPDGDRAIRALCGTDQSPARPDLVLLDLNLPIRDGLEVLAAIRGTSDLTEVPVVVLTSSHSPVDRKQAERLGATRYLSKPTDLDEFLALVGDAVREFLP